MNHRLHVTSRPLLHAHHPVTPSLLPSPLQQPTVCSSGLPPSLIFSGFIFVSLPQSSSVGLLKHSVLQLPPLPFSRPVSSSFLPVSIFRCYESSCLHVTRPSAAASSPRSSWKRRPHCHFTSLWPIFSSAFSSQVFNSGPSPTQLSSRHQLSSCCRVL